MATTQFLTIKDKEPLMQTAAELFISLDAPPFFTLQTPELLMDAILLLYDWIGIETRTVAVTVRAANHYRLHHNPCYSRVGHP
jgi:hypothetical protein